MKTKRYPKYPLLDLAAGLILLSVGGVFLVVIILALFTGGCATRPTVTRGIPNFRTVDSTQGIYRGGQPNLDGWWYLQGLGVSNVIKLNTTEEGADPAVTFGMKLNYLPIDLLHQTAFKPAAMTVSNAVACFGPGTYVHCEHGQDRTGLIVACYRIWRCGWAKTNAVAEMNANGFHYALHGLADFMEDNVQ